MTAKLSPEFQRVNKQPGCVQAVFGPKKSFVSAQDNRGQVFMFDRLTSPAVLIEHVRTQAGNIRGNHVHATCNETLYVMSGTIELYLLCTHNKHIFGSVLQPGDSVVISKGTPHALFSVQDSECMVCFDKDPRRDRAAVPILLS